MPRLPWLCDRVLLPYRLARARASRSFPDEHEAETPLAVDVFRCGFPPGEVAYNGIGAARDGTVYFSVGTKSTTAGRLFAFDPRSEGVSLVADLDAAFPSSTERAIPQGKVHVDLAPVGDRLYGATHVGFYRDEAGPERPGHADGYAPYPGGWFFAIAGGRVLPCAQAPAGEGVIAMSVDGDRARAYALSWPGGRLLIVDLPSGRVRDRGPVMGAGESGSLRAGEWRRVCRSLAVHPPTGHVFWSDSSGAVWRLADERIERVAQLPVADMWRKVCWHPERRMFYGWTWRDAVLFSFDPVTFMCQALTTLPAPGTLAFALAANGNQIHVLARCHGMRRRGRIQLAETVSHIGYDLASGTTTVRGPLYGQDGPHTGSPALVRGITQAQSLLLAGDHAYAVAWVEVPAGDASSYAQAVRAHRRNGVEYRHRGYAEEIALIRFAIGPGVHEPVR